MRQLRIDANSPFLGKTLKEAGIREKYHCLIAGVERGEETLHAPDVHEPFVEGDVVWIVGESVDVYKLVGEMMKCRPIMLKEQLSLFCKYKLKRIS